MTYIQVVSTTNRKEEARAIAEELLLRRLAACVQIEGPLESTYWWEDSREVSDEWRVVIKSRLDLYPALEQAVLALHPYDVPELLVTRIETGHAAYIEWMARELAGARPNEPGPSAAGVRLFRVILPVNDIDRAAEFYGRLLEATGKRVSPGRHYFDCGGTILACFDPRADGDPFDARPNPGHVYFAVDDLEAVFGRAAAAGCAELDERIETRPWGERSFYAHDPFGNRICFVDQRTVFAG